MKEGKVSGKSGVGNRAKYAFVCSSRPHMKGVA
jgi:hypothetical protein